MGFRAKSFCSGRSKEGTTFAWSMTCERSILILVLLQGLATEVQSLHGGAADTCIFGASVSS